jgi:hypothetical protein
MQSVRQCVQAVASYADEVDLAQGEHMAKKATASTSTQARTTASKARTSSVPAASPHSAAAPVTGTHKKPIEAASRPVDTAAKSDVASAATVREPSHEDIARRAFELYQARGGYEGAAMTDWLRAEQELRATQH